MMRKSGMRKVWLSRLHYMGMRSKIGTPGCQSPLMRAVPRFLTELCFGDFNTRTGLDGKTRELLTVVLLAALGGAEVQVKSHVEGA